MPVDTFAKTSVDPLSWLQPFGELYRQRFGGSIEYKQIDCEQAEPGHYRVCSPLLRNPGNAPYIVHHGQPTEKVMILLHGLSDSPFYYQSLAPEIAQQGYTVIVALLPAHGLNQPEAAMLDNNLKQLWQQHTRELVDFAHTIGSKVSIGGFSTGGALATQYVLENPGRIEQLLLFSGALALPKPVEWLAKIPGISGLMKRLDKGYASGGANPYKYPEVSKYSAWVLMQIIFEIRESIASGKGLDLPIFSAHSQADVTTPIYGIENLLEYNRGANLRFFIAENNNVCHANLLFKQSQIDGMGYDFSAPVDDPCLIPTANPEHDELVAALQKFLR